MRILLRTLLVALLLASASCAAEHPQQLSAWIVGWQLDEGLQEAEAVNTIQLFAASFGPDDEILIDGDFAALLDNRHALFANHSVLMAVVNDRRDADDTVVLKDSTLISRLMATPESRIRHLRELSDLAQKNSMPGLVLDYENIAEADWPNYLEFVRAAYDEFKASGLLLRVILEPKPRYFLQQLPAGPEYTVMGYNLFGPHSGPGPKANPAFIAGLAQQCREAGVEARLALSLGGFAWNNDGSVSAVTEVEAAELAMRTKSPVRRDIESAYLVFSHGDKKKMSEVWYADAVTVQHLLRAAKEHGFDSFDFWRLGGNTPATLASMRVQVDQRPDSRTLRVGSGEYGSITAAVQAALPGDRIIVAAGEYTESIRIDTQGLTISSPAGSETDMPVRVRGTLRDSADTLWRGVAFTGGNADGVLLELDNFTGRFEHCGFFTEPSESVNAAAVTIHSGFVSFHACTFRSSGFGSAVSVNAISLPDRAGATADFTYCHFDGFGDHVAELKGDSDTRFANCLFNRNGYIITRPARHNGTANVINSVLFFNQARSIVNNPDTDNPVRLTNCVVTPRISSRFGSDGNPENAWQGALAESCQTVSPRFRRVGEDLKVNVGIDGLTNLELFKNITTIAKPYSHQLTFAVNTNAASESDWRQITDLVQSGHEIASFTTSRSSLQMEAAMSVGYAAKEALSATLDIVRGREIIITVNDRTIGSVRLDETGSTLALVARSLREHGLLVFLSPRYAATPSSMLAEAGARDILFPKPSVPLYLERDAFVNHELLSSFQELASRIGPMRDAILVNPFDTASPFIKNAALEAGYSGMRSAIENDQNHSVNQNGISAPGISFVPGVSTRLIRDLTPSGLAENLRLALDFAKLNYSSLALFSRSYRDLEPEQWKELMGILHEDPEVKVLSLAGISANEGSEERRPGNSDYRPLSNSPLIEAGKPLGLTRDFAGQPVVHGKAPNIGLFQ